jgi:outer membrane lipoprotein-sorting protein
MKRLAALAMVFAPITAAAIPQPVAAQVSAPLAQVQAHLRGVETMTASFVQTDRRGRSMNGTLTLKRPGKVRFQYGKGVPLLVVGDGKALTMIDYEVRQVSRWPIGNSPLAVLLDPSKDLSRFAKVRQNDAQVLLVDARDPRRPEFGTITLAFAKVSNAPAGLLLRGWTMLDAQNRWTDPRSRSPKG